MIHHLYKDRFLRQLDKLECGKLSLKTPEGQTRIFEGKNPGPEANIEIRDWSMVGNLAANGDIGFAEDYKNGNWETSDLLLLINLALLNKQALDNYVLGNSFSRLFSQLTYLLRLNTLKGSKKNIHAHYDLGNDFYKLWLDPSMTYSSALFNNKKEGLLTAQMNKYDRIIDRLDEQSGSILEVGCGWGGFAERATTHKSKDYALKGITLSEEQHDYATKRLNGNANIALEDYRHQSGKFDNIVSIEMFEAVGEKFWKTYFSKLGSLLKQNGKAVIQTITIDNDHFDRYKRGGDFIRSYIFPGGMLPSEHVFKQEVEKAGLRVTDSFSFGQDYATTLELWLQKFDSQIDRVKSLGFDEPFIRLWRFYLAACAAGFRAERTNVYQFEVQHV